MEADELLLNVLRTVATVLEVPVHIVLVIIMAAALVLAGSIIVETFTERIHLKEKLPVLIDKIRDNEGNLAPVIEKSGLLRRQKKALVEIISHPELTDAMREALALRLLEEERNRYARIVRYSELVAKLGPMFGLLGTLIPLGPGIISLGNGDTVTLSNSLLAAFDTTIAGLSSAAVATVISMIRKAWYNNYMSILETVMECVTEAVRDGKVVADNEAFAAAPDMADTLKLPNDGIDIITEAKETLRQGGTDA